MVESLGIALGLTLLPIPVAAFADSPVPAAAKPQKLGQTAADFYQARSEAPLWLTPVASDAAQQLLILLDSAATDGLDPTLHSTAAIREALAVAQSGKKKDVLRADRLLSDAFVAYVSDIERDPGVGVIYVDPQLRPRPPSPRAVLLNAAGVHSLGEYVRKLDWMNPIYGELRRAIAGHQYADARQLELLRINLERARTLPGGPQRYILVNAAQQRLFTFADRKQVDSMRVVVGKPKYPTPMMAAYVRFAALNPYWYVPPDLASERIAPRVVQRGLGYLKELGHEVLTNWSDDAQVIDPKTIDWKSVASGKTEVLIRQKPGPHNSMGRMKFMFPNDAGVYLHDNPERELFSEASRLYSGGCVRLEDAARLGEWLFGHKLDPDSAGTEERVALPQAVPVYITYLTAMPEGQGIAFFDDVYGRDSARLAALGGNPAEAAAR